MTATIELEPDEGEELKRRTDKPDVEAALREVTLRFLNRAPTRPAHGESGRPPGPLNREDWLRELDRLRESIGTGKEGASTEAILDDLRADR